METPVAIREDATGVLAGDCAPPAIGLALGGGFARGMAHVGVLQAFEEERVPIGYISGVSSGAIVAAAYASGTRPEEIARVCAALRFGDVARWTFCKLGFCCTDGMTRLLARLLKNSNFEEMAIPLTVVATDLQTGAEVVFSGTGDVHVAIRASCAFPGIFQPVRWNGRILADGALCMEVPAKLVRDMGADRVISVGMPHEDGEAEPTNIIDVVGRSLQIMQMRTQELWRSQSDLVILPEVNEWPWHDFRNSGKMIEAGAKAARKTMPRIRAWLDNPAAWPSRPAYGIQAGDITRLSQRRQPRI